jgi:hypothetical protein
VHMASWCSYAHIESGTFISHQTMITHFFQNSHTPLEAYLVHVARMRVITKKDNLLLDERSRFNLYICAPAMFPCEVINLLQGMKT